MYKKVFKRLFDIIISMLAIILLLPFFIEYEIEKSSMLPATVPRMLPFFDVRWIDFPAPARLQTTSPPLEFRVMLSRTSTPFTVIFSFVVFTESEYIWLSGIRMFIFLSPDEGFFVPI